MKQKIIELIERLTECDGISSDTDLLAEGIVDSFTFLLLLEELEQAFQIEIQPTQVPGDTWRSVDRIAKLVETQTQLQQRRRGSV